MNLINFRRELAALLVSSMMFHSQKAFNSDVLDKIMNELHISLNLRAQLFNRKLDIGYWILNIGQGLNNVFAVSIIMLPKD